MRREVGQWAGAGYHLPVVIETQTTWTDSGFDCDHCGGRIFRRIDSETGRPDVQCYQCEQCGCQWTLDNQPLRVGKLRACRAAQRRRSILGETDTERYARWFVIGIVAIAGLFVLRFAGPFVLRFLLPVLIIGVVVYFGVRYLRQLDE